MSVSPWERGGVNRCPRPSRQALPLTPVSPTCLARPSCVAPPTPVASGLGGRVCMASWLLHCAAGSGQRFFFQRSPSKIQHLRLLLLLLLLLHLPHLPPFMVHFVSEGVDFGVWRWRVFLHTGSGAAVFAAWLRCYAKAPPTSSPPPPHPLPLMVHVVPGRPLAPPIAARRPTLLLTFNPFL